jgi:hypothetical protein
VVNFSSKIQVLWVQDLRIKHLSVLAGPGAALGSRSSASISQLANNMDPTQLQFAFELIVVKTRKRAQSSIVFICDDEASKLAW